MEALRGQHLSETPFGVRHGLVEKEKAGRLLIPSRFPRSATRHTVLATKCIWEYSLWLSHPSCGGIKAPHSIYLFRPPKCDGVR